ncbi:hypothetical protein [Winogradskyella flava]|uniref:Uncharacterized protein n=1 Tax=Winogradskyella flava TaxID=1884876 RepID=A0A842IQM3_9FLAO|nr:hypothetical protein [Winogradskyella flava]MBC2844509.1 hypothetical protein [Winogradskyella flava]
MKKTTLYYLLLILISFSCSNDTDDIINQSFNNETGIIQLSPLEEITQGSELFQNLVQVATDKERPDHNITCINFNYPLSIFVFDANDEFTSLNAVLDDEEFSLLLESLETDFSISVSFPITAILESGEEFIINTKEELKQSIDSCLDFERVSDCNQILENCILKVGYGFTNDNPYLGGIFEESNGFTTFNFEERNFIGSWTVFLIEDELHININLVSENSEITDYFNYDWKVTYIDENSLKLSNEDRDLVLNQRCDQDFDLCSSFYFEVCENETNTGVSDFILNDYVFCILDTLELDEDSVISFHETQEDAQNDENPVAGDQVYNNTENNQSIFVKIIDEENLSDYVVEIILISIGC